MSFIRVFGCDAYVHVPKEKSSKLDSTSEIYKFVGFKADIKGYKLWNPMSRSIISSRDLFLER
ncbi:hypothetical protein Pint_27293 [Pistacia integerrima]|uniref:Uncharacterized protein n=1 Tax=Pistacia integerrima TaxID=434235 RepID=A0ACC0YQZ9_9ROSI|nr:hypothetical protein Pint_27293 [Pistacia integerrima]